MKKMSDLVSKKVKGGAAHYHWVCTVNSFWSTKYSTNASANSARKAHTVKYPSHSLNTYVTSCTGRC
ncbi:MULTISPECIES: hypothetical protein [Carnobacterium]|uniref:hypothetical protein n=1 Tax=Carnobacterium TaxID=2747 RepID=UPI0010727523|nr:MULTISPECIES: hypothetical protein [Carnobacterium]MDT1940671.1 hypothetical protein [Carnobacterium divergens]MDT1943109.1 hypothetical protein [Carnobacterium divergens]MDT1948916.1 hypothetical protein [Carnobacterium divergens]MDT1951397.1 hypothetical protein [Carnobacterium divergens]MDT1956454.1 hypothetical protein [Carnobacterium divergens]